MPSLFVLAVIQANEEIYNYLQSGLNESDFAKGAIGAGGDKSSGIDLYAESVFVKHLRKFGTIESEESGIIGVGDEKIIIDPIDGSSNLLSLFPYYGSSVAKIKKNGLLDCAIICNLANGELFIKEGINPPLQGKLFDVKFQTPLVSPNAEIGIFEKAYENPQIVALLKDASMKFRAPGAVALSLAYARNVEFVLFVGAYRIYDFAAGLALCEGLEVVVEEEYVIVSKKLETLKSIEKIVISAL